MVTDALSTLYYLEPHQFSLVTIISLFVVVPFIRGYLLVGLGVLLRNLPYFRHKAVSEVTLPRDRFWIEFWSGTKCFIVDGCFLGLFTYFQWMNFQSEFSWQHLILSMLLTFIIYETWFYFIHRALHAKPLFWIHKYHHLGDYPHPMTAFSFSALERIIEVSVALSLITLLSHYYPLSPLGFAISGFLAASQSVYGHLNVEVYPKWLINFKLGRMVSTATYHSLHHKKLDGHYGLTITFWDRVFGTCWWEEYLENWERVHRKDKA